MKPLDEILRDSATRHRRLCPRQVLGARVGMFAASLLTLDLPQSDKRLLAFVETDGCFVDGVSAATGCYVGRRTLRVEDFGKTAAVFVDTRVERAVRIAPRLDIRVLSKEYAPEAKNRWEAQLLSY
ncbi:MAG TPA: FmdE family protein, partial [Anaerolineales bacterium]|nr:FmdE family protein [Anaerolineales bacterium]